jgi:hypothetical protein
MEPEVHNIVDVLPGHSHPGPASYSMYVQGCRACLPAANEYKLRLEQRKLSGEYRDLRLRKNKLRADAEQLLAKIAADPELAEQFRHLLSDEPTTPEPAASAPEPAVEPQEALPESSGEGEENQAVTDDSGATENGFTVDANRVLGYLRLGLGRDGKVSMSMFHSMPAALQLMPDRCQAALDELEQAGLLSGDGTNLYLGRQSVLPEAASQPRSADPRYTAFVDPITGQVMVRA